MHTLTHKMKKGMSFTLVDRQPQNATTALQALRRYPYKVYKLYIGIIGTV